ncbi:Fur family transcriptional regulator [Streptomyces sulphureus]|uniref:Fur family transcriptional regulator n=1 Tax=Streptomyces sulphureus TaxID=47758 RepID=UPI00035F8A45|nr:transcriptional repressor [Streptomyces sulphureus]
MFTVKETPDETPLGARRTRQRLDILQHLSAAPDFVSAQGLHARLAQAGTCVGLSTVYRALRDLERMEQVDVIRHEASGERLYRKRSTTEHRHYVICRRCGRSEAVDTDLVERWAAHLDQLTGFSNVTHTLELSGECMDCHL